VSSDRAIFKETLVAVSVLLVHTRRFNPDTLVVPSKRTLPEVVMIILLVVLLLVFGFGGYRLGPGIGYYGGGGLSLIVLIVLVLLLMRVI
jgi:hypothetical protein